MSIRKAIKQLESARDTGTLVRVHRSIDPGHTNGYVCEVGEQFVLLSVVSSEIRFDGFQALRISDISRVVLPAPYHAFVERALQLRKLKRPRAPALYLSDVSSLLMSTSAAFPLVTVHREVAAPDVCHIGVVQRITAKTVVLREIDPNAKWDRKPRRYSLADITRVDAGGAYEDALHLVESACGVLIPSAVPTLTWARTRRREECARAGSARGPALTTLGCRARNQSSRALGRCRAAD